VLLFLREVLFIDLIALALTALVSFLLQRATWYQFAETLTIAGAIVMVFGAAGSLGSSNPRLARGQFRPMDNRDVYTRKKETQASYHFMFVTFTAGAGLILLSVLIHSLAG
jgi:hypothetical protein